MYIFYLALMFLLCINTSSLFCKNRELFGNYKTIIQLFLCICDVGTLSSKASNQMIKSKNPVSVFHINMDFNMKGHFFSSRLGAESPSGVESPEKMY